MNKVIKEVNWIEGAAIVVATGEITIEQSPDLHRSLVDICNKGTTHMVIDLTAVTYIDSSGVGTLVEIFRRLKRGNGKMALVGMQPTVQSVFEITRLDKFFAIYETCQEALDS